MSSRVEPGIWLTKTQRYSVRVADRHGSTLSVSRTVDDLSQARLLVAQARRTREAGGSVSEAWAAEDANRMRSAPRTVGAVLDEFLSERLALVNRCDKTRAANHSGVSALRDGSHETERSQIECHIRPLLGETYTTDVDTAAVRRVVAEMCRKGLAVSSQQSVLTKLRQILGGLGTSHRPDDFPWKNVKPEPPAKPRTKRNDPSKWGGRPGSDPPGLLIAQMLAVVALIRAPHRIVGYIQALMGLRRGEIMGLDNRAFDRADGRLWMSITQQRGVDDGELKKWVKADASYRRLPIPHVLTRYIHKYWDHYHDGYRPELGASHGRHEAQLVVTGVGRDIDGSFLPARGTSYTYDLNGVLASQNMTHEDLGYTIRPHHFRASLSAHLLGADVILATLAESFPAAPEEMSDEETVKWARAHMQASLEHTKLRFPESAVSMWLGHEVDTDDRAKNGGASAVTLGHYNPTLGDPNKALCAIADFIDMLVAQITDRLNEEPDKEDSLLVVDPKDPNWLNLARASACTGLAEVSLGQSIAQGYTPGQLCWYSDGDTGAPGPRYVISRAAVDTIVKRRAATNRSEASRILGMSHNYVDAALARGQLKLVERCASVVYLDTASVHALHHAILATVASLFDGPTATSVDSAFAAFCRSGDLDDYDIAREMITNGATFDAAAKKAGVNPNTLRSVSRRQGWFRPAAAPEPRAEVRRLFAHPYRVKRPAFERWIAEATERGLLRRTTTDYYRRQHNPPHHEVA